MARRSGPDPEDIKRIRELFRKAAPLIGAEMRRALRTHGDDWDRRMDDRLRGPLPVYGTVNTSDILASRTGALRRSKRVEVVGNRLGNLQLLLGIGRGLPYAALQERGGVIVPKRSKYLAIPIEENLTPAGVRRRPSPRDYPDGVFYETADKRLFFGLRRGDGGFDNLFALRKRVKIRPRLGAQKTLDDMRPDLVRRVAQAIRRGLEAA